MFRFEWLGLAILVTLTVWSRPAAKLDHEHRRETRCSLNRIRTELDDIARMRERAIAESDTLYRSGDSARAALRVTLVAKVLPTDTELHSLVELYAEFAVASATVAAPETSTVDRFVALRRAQALDMALGGAFADRLNARMREVAPEAAAAYERAHDRIGADLAEHTAALFR